MPYRFQEDETLAAGMRRIVREQLEEAIRQLEGEPVSHKAIHQARKAFKKIRSLLRLMQSRIGEEHFHRENKALRHAGRKLGRARDAQVRAATLAALLDGESTDAALEEMLREFQSEGDAAAADAAGSGAVQQTLHSLRAAVERIDGWADAEWSDARDGLARAYARGRRMMKQSRKDGSDEQLHDWRKRVKDLWYHTRLLRGLWPAVMKPLAAELHRLSGLLGDDHDLATLRGEILAQSERFGEKSVAEALMQIDRERARVQASMWRLGARIYAEKPKAFMRRIDAWRDVMLIQSVPSY